MRYMQMKKAVVAIGLGLSLMACAPKGQNAVEAHTFSVDTVYAHTRPLSQGRTSTCWAFASASLMESEWMNVRSEDTLRLSPMYVVRQKYLDQFEAYYYSQGGEEIRGGSLGHTFLRVWRKRLANEAVDSRDLPHYRAEVVALLDREMGAVPQTFLYKGKEYTPRSFADSLGLDPENYVELTSFTHHPFHTSFVLEVPDNWEHAPYYNLPLDELEEVVRQALANGFTVAWDGDVSEETYSAKAGLAEWPQHPVSQEMRQQGFEQYVTTDDHMMHIVGTARDEKGGFYYVLKNSYGRYGAYEGMLYMSEDYFRAKTLSVMLNRKAFQ